MNKALTQKIVEAGIVPAHAIKQLKAWRQLPDDLPEEEKERATQEQLMHFVRDIGALLEEDGELPELRETIPGIEATFDAQCQDCFVVVPMGNQNLTITTLVYSSKVYRSLIFRADDYGAVVAQVGNQVALSGEVKEITGVSPLYSGPNIAFYGCNFQEVPSHAQMPELRELST